MFYVSCELDKNSIFYTGYNDDGVKEKKELKNLPWNSFNILVSDWEKIKFQVSSAIAAEKINIPYKATLSEFKTIYGDDTYEVSFPFQFTRKVREIIENYKIPIYGDIDYNYKLINLLSLSENYKVDTRKIKVGYFDIEVESENGFSPPSEANERINAISLKVDKGTLYSWGLGDYVIDDPNIDYRCFHDEKDMLLDFLNTWKKLDLDVISGWNTSGYDIPYIVNRYKNLFGGRLNYGVLEDCIATQFSPFGKIKEVKVKNKFGAVNISYEIAGVIHVDYMNLYMKYSYDTKASYSLNNIANEELGEGKLDYSEYQNLHQLYKKNFQKFMEYNIRDSQLVEKINNKTKMMELGETVMYMCFINFNDIYSPIKSWDSLIYNYLYKEKKTINPRKDTSQGQEAYPGAYVVPPEAGICRWICSFDFNSLYPNIMRQLNLSPETIMDETYTGFKESADDSIEEDPYRISGIFKMKADLSIAKEKGYSMSSNGNFFRKDIQGFIPKLVAMIYGDRKATKKVMLTKKSEQEKLEKELESDPNNKDLITKIDDLEFEISSLNSKQMGLKIVINALYGSFASIYNRWSDIRFSRSITLTAQTMNRHVKYAMNNFLSGITGIKKNYVKGGDTDSLYINLSDIYDHFNFKNIDELDNYIKEVIEPFIEDEMVKMCDYLNNYELQMVMKREVIASKGIFTKKKKRYSLLVADNEGVRYAEPHLKIIGLNIIKGTTPKLIQGKLKPILYPIMDNNLDGLIDYVYKTKDEFFKMKPEEIAIPMKVSDFGKYEDSEYQAQYLEEKGRKLATPMNARATLVYNNYIKNNGLDKEYNYIQENSKIYYILLDKDNPTGSDVIAFPEVLPTDLVKYVDYEKMFEKVFLDSVKCITDDLDWNIDLRQKDIEILFEGNVEEF